MNLSKLSESLTGSAIRDMFNEALKVNDTISFTVGEPDFVTPKPIIDAACEAWQRGAPSSNLPAPDSETGSRYPQSRIGCICHYLPRGFRRFGMTFLSPLPTSDKRITCTISNKAI